MFSVIDLVLLGVIAFSALVSIFRGFVRELLSIITWVAAFWVAWQFSKPLSLMLDSYIKSATLRYPVAFIGLFVITIILGGLTSFLIGQLVDKTGLSATDRTLGLAFGLLRGVLVVGVLLLILRLTPAPREPWWQQSRLIPVFSPIENWLKSFLPQDQQPNFVMTNTP